MTPNTELSDEQILRLWDTHVAYETGGSAKQPPLGNKDKLAFARAVLAASPAPLSEGAGVKGLSDEQIDTLWWRYQALDDGPSCLPNHRGFARSILAASTPSGSEGAEPVAWICTRRLDGDKALFEIPCTTANPAYVKAHPRHDWKPLYLSPTSPPIGKTEGDADGVSACPKAAHCWDRFNCIAKGNCQPTPGVPASPSDQQEGGA